MSFFLYRFVPTRPDFLTSMTDYERGVMAEHIEYWRKFAETGTAVVFGPVADPAGGWGVAVVESDSEEEVMALRTTDPVVVAELGPVDVFPMPNAVSRH
jgi:uncharacterized protein YciI